MVSICGTRLLSAKSESSISLLSSFSFSCSRARSVYFGSFWLVTFNVLMSDSSSKESVSRFSTIWRSASMSSCAPCACICIIMLPIFWAIFFIWSAAFFCESEAFLFWSLSSCSLLSSWLSETDSSSFSKSSILLGFSSSSFFFSRSSISFLISSNFSFSSSCFWLNASFSADFSFVSSESSSCSFANSSKRSMVCSSFCSNSICLKSSRLLSSSFSRSSLDSSMSSNNSWALFLVISSMSFSISSNSFFISSDITSSNNFSSCFCFSTSCGSNSIISFILEFFCSVFCWTPSIFFCNAFCICSTSFIFSLSSQSKFFLSRRSFWMSLMDFFISSAIFMLSEISCFSFSLLESFSAANSSMVATRYVFFSERDDLLPFTPSLSQTSK